VYEQDVVLFALKEWPVLGLRIGDKKNLGPFRTNQIAQYHAFSPVVPSQGASAIQAWTFGRSRKLLTNLASWVGVIGTT
jgi:hypothetical protein